jgi:putative tryptophan/tyrosine transport system substrate-binding protein
MRRRTFLTGLTVSVLPVLPAAAQEKAPLVAILSPASRTAAVLKLVNEPFKQALRELGYEPDRSIELVERFAEGDETRLPALAAELVAMQPRVLFTNTNAGSAAAAAATRTIPIVVGPAGEAVIVELAGGSLARPSTNVTGVVLTSPEIDTKCLALLLEAVPAARRIGILVNPRNPGQQGYPAALRAWGTSSPSLVRLEATGPADVDAALLQALRAQTDALFVADDAHIAGNPAARERVIRFAMENRKPVASSHQNYAREGALIAMGPSIPALAARAAGYIDKILKGARPADLPIERPSVFTTIINVRTANALGLDIPPSLLARADEVIE